jgi:hypothetical protein
MEQETQTDIPRERQHDGISNPNPHNNIHEIFNIQESTLGYYLLTPIS